MHKLQLLKFIFQGRTKKHSPSIPYSEVTILKIKICYHKVSVKMNGDISVTELYYITLHQVD